MLVYEKKDGISVPGGDAIIEALVTVFGSMPLMLTNDDVNKLMLMKAAAENKKPYQTLIEAIELFDQIWLRKE